MSNQRMQLGQQIYQFFLDRGLPPHQAAAIAGNMAWEGGGRTDLINPGDNIRNSPRSPHSFGIGQWNDRLPALISYARAQGIDIPEGDLRDTNYLRTIAPMLNLDTQLRFAWNEMQGPENRAFRLLTRGGDLQSAAQGAISYHRPAGWTWGNPSAGHGFMNRVSLGNQIMSAGGTQPQAPQPQTPAFDPAAVPPMDQAAPRPSGAQPPPDPASVPPADMAPRPSSAPLIATGTPLGPEAPTAANPASQNTLAGFFGLNVPTGLAGQSLVPPAETQTGTPSGVTGGLFGSELQVGPFSIGGNARGAQAPTEEVQAQAPPSLNLAPKPLDMRRVLSILNNRSRLGLG